MKLKKFDDFLNENHSMSDGKAKEYAYNLLVSLGHAKENYPLLIEYVKNSTTFVKYIELLSEIKEIEEDADSKVFISYVDEKIPTNDQLEVLKHYGDKAIKEFNAQRNKR